MRLTDAAGQTRRGLLRVPGDVAGESRSGNRRFHRCVHRARRKSVRYCRPDAELDIKTWAADGASYFEKHFGSEPNAAGKETFGGLPAIWTRLEKGTVDTILRFIISVALVKGRAACDIQWFRALGPTGDEDEVFTNVHDDLRAGLTGRRSTRPAGASAARHRGQRLPEDLHGFGDLGAGDVDRRDPAHDFVLATTGQDQQPGIGAGGHQLVR